MTRVIRILSIAVLMMAGLVGSSLPARAEDKCDKIFTKRNRSCATPWKNMASTANKLRSAAMNSKT